MPTYEYKCEDCGDRFEYFQSMTSERLTTCKKCGGKLRRLIGEGAGVIFKGSGFYCTDYKGKQNPMPEHDAKHKAPAAAASASASASKPGSTAPSSAS